MRQQLLNAIEDSLKALEQLKQPQAIAFIEDVAVLLASSFKNGNKLIVAGNGGSLCDAAHFAEELTGFYRDKRPALPAIALSEPGHMSCVGNDIGFEFVFSRGIEAYGQKGDVFVGLTTSGNSINLVNAFKAAKDKGLVTIAFLGKNGGKLKGCADYELIIDGFKYSDRIQEAHMAAIHMIIELMETLLFPSEIKSTTCAHV